MHTSHQFKKNSITEWENNRQQTSVRSIFTWVNSINTETKPPLGVTQTDYLPVSHSKELPTFIIHNSQLRFWSGHVVKTHNDIMISGDESLTWVQIHVHTEWILWPVTTVQIKKLFSGSFTSHKIWFYNCSNSMRLVYYLSLLFNGLGNLFLANVVEINVTYFKIFYYLNFQELSF